MATSHSITKSTLTTFWGYLKETLVIPNIASNLIEHGVLSPDDWMDLKKRFHGSEMTEQFLYILYSKKTNAYAHFAEALIAAGRSDVVDVLEGRKERPRLPRHEQESKSTESARKLEERRRDKEELVSSVKAAVKSELETSGRETRDLIKRLDRKLEDSLRKHENDIEALRQELSKGKISSSSIQEDLEKKQKECTDLKKEAVFIRKQLEMEMKENIKFNEMNVSLKEKDEKIKRLTSKIQHLESSNKGNMDRIKQLNEELRTVRREKRESEDEKQEETKRFMKEIDDKEKRIKELLRQIDDMRMWRK